MAFYYPLDGISIFLLLLVSYSVVGVDEFVKNLVTSNSIERVESSNLKVASNLVFDLNPKTCLRVVSSKKKDPRWIQLHFKRQNMFTRLNVTVQDRHGNFSIFVIVELSNNRTKFTKCNHESNRTTPNNQVHFSFQCPNEGLRGRKIFIRDDKKELNEFHVCEVQVFGTPLYMNSTDCPYIPNIRNGRTKMKKHRLSFVCKKGYVLWGHQEITCTNGKWSSKPPQCRPLTCTVPDESESEDTVFKLPRNVTRIHLGDEASVFCKKGFLLMTNSSKGVVIMNEVLAVCSQIGTWEIKANFNCVNSTFIHSAQTWPSYSTISLIHTVFIALSLFLLVLLVILTIILYRRNQNSIKASDNPSQKNESNPPLSQNSDRDTSTTTIYDDDIHIPDSGSLIRGPPVDDASIIRENCFKQQIDAKNEIFFKSTPMTTFKPNQNISCPMSNIPTNYCVAWTQSHAAFQPSDENALENQSLEEQSSISCLPEKDDSQHIYANVNENHRGYANLISNHFNKRNETIYANDVMIQGNKNTFDQFVYSQIKPNK